MRSRLISFAKRNRGVQQVGRLLDTLVPSPGRLCTVLTFHRIDTHERELYPGLAGLDAASFERFIDQLVERWKPIAVGELLGALSDEHRLPERSVLVTFDDAYRDFAEVAWPIMRARGVPVVLFVPTAHPDDPARQFWWDELYAALAATRPSDWRAIAIDASSPDEAFRSVRDEIKAMPHTEAVRTIREMVTELRTRASVPTPPAVERVLRWSELRALASQGVTLAPHSRTHPMLDQLEPDQLDPEVRGSLEDMHRHLGRDCVTPVFAYPAGGHDPRVHDAVRRAGYAAAFTTTRGLVDVGRSDPYRLPRLNVGRESSFGTVAAEASVRRLQTSRRSAPRDGLG